MRIFRMVFGGLAIVMVLVVGGYYGWEKILIGIESVRLRNQLASLKQLAYKPIGSSCRTDGILGIGTMGYQLKFETATDYVIEPVCVGAESGKVIKRGKLKYGVMRKYGSGSMVTVTEGVPSIEDSWVHLGLNKTETVVGFFNGLPEVKWRTEGLAIGGAAPAYASCSQWGFSCCLDGLEVGEATKVRTYDCVNNCYQHCNRRPVTLFFNTEPVLNQSRRQVQLTRRAAVVSFGYGLSDDDDFLEVKIDFGDGQVADQLPAKIEDLEHRYECVLSTCVYDAVLSAKDDAGNSLTASPLNRLTVVVR